MNRVRGVGPRPSGTRCGRVQVVSVWKVSGTLPASSCVEFWVETRRSPTFGQAAR